MKAVLDEAIGELNFDAEDPAKLGHFLGGDNCSLETLHNRGKFLNILLQKHLESKDKQQWKSTHRVLNSTLMEVENC